MTDSFRDLTIVCLEIPWSDGFRSSDGFAAESSVAPFLSALSVNFGNRIIHRSVHSAEDWSRWCGAIKNQHLGKRILWVAGHGERSSKGVSALSLPKQKPGVESLLSPSQVANGLEKCGDLEGIIVHSCSFGANPPGKWLHKTKARWALAFAKDVFWTDSMFFAMKTLEWIYADKAPGKSKTAADYYRSGVESGRVKSKDDRVNLSHWAQALGAQFYFRKQNTSWEAINFDSLPGIAD